MPSSQAFTLWEEKDLPTYRQRGSNNNALRFYDVPASLIPSSLLQEWERDANDSIIMKDDHYHHAATILHGFLQHSVRAFALHLVVLQDSFL